MEKWKVIPDFSDYEVSDKGRIRRITGGKGARAGRILRPTPHTHGYAMAGLYVNGVSFKRTIHRLVAETFLGPRPEGSEINHKDGDKQNNALVNLEYVTSSGNHIHAVKTGLAYVGELNGQVKLSDAAVEEIKKAYMSGLSQRNIAFIYGVSQGHVSALVTGKKRSRPANK